MCWQPTLKRPVSAQPRALATGQQEPVTHQITPHWGPSPAARHQPLSPTIRLFLLIWAIPTLQRSQRVLTELGATTMTHLAWHSPKIRLTRVKQVQGHLKSF